MRYKIAMRGIVSVHERDLAKALAALETWAKGLDEADEVCFCRCGGYGVYGVDLAVDFTCSWQAEGKEERVRRLRRGRSASDGPQPVAVPPDPDT